MDTASKWGTGTYEMLLETDVNGVEVSITVFAKPLNPDNEVESDIVPVLAQLDLTNAELGIPEGGVPAWQPGLYDVGEIGVTPENAEREFGPQMGLRVLLALTQAAERDLRGVDMDAQPWRGESWGAYAIMERAHDVMLMLKTRLYDL